MSGKTPLVSRDTHVPGRRHLSLRLQENVPIPDAYLNEFSDILTDTVRNALRAKFGSTVRVGDAFDISQSTPDNTNNFTINGVDTAGDPPKMAVMDGLLATIFEETWEYDSSANFLHEGVATLDPGASPTLVTDIHQDFQTTEDDLVGCRLLWTKGILDGTEFAITGYTQDTIQLAGDAASAVIGDTYKILPPALTTPGGVRNDEVYLSVFWVDINEQESAALYGATPIVDPSLGEEVYHARALRVCVRVAENGSTPTDVPDAGNGVEYRYLHIATLARTAVDTILSGNITNVNPAAGNLTAHQAASPLDHPDASVTLAKMAPDSVDGSKIADDAIAPEHLATDAVEGGLGSTPSILPASIAEADLGFSIASAADLTSHATAAILDHPNGSVTKVKLGADSVDGTKVEDAAIDNEHIASDAVRGVTASGGVSNVEAGSVGSADLSSATDTEAVATGNLRSGAVTLPKRGNLTPTAKSPASAVVAVAAGTGVVPAGDSPFAGADGPTHVVVTGAGQSRKDMVFLDEGGALKLLKGKESAGTPTDPPTDGLATIYQTIVNEEVTVQVTTGEIIDLRGDRAEMFTEAARHIGGLHMDWKSATQVTFNVGELTCKGIVVEDDDLTVDVHSKGRLRRLITATDFGVSELDEAEGADVFYYVYAFATTSNLIPLIRLSSTAPGADGYYPSRPWRHVGTVLNNSAQDFEPFTKLDRDTTIFRDANAFVDGVGAMNVLSGGSSGTFLPVDCSAWCPETARGIYLAVATSASTTQWELRVDGSADANGFIRRTGPGMVWLPINDGGTVGRIEYRVLGASGNITINVGGFKERLS